MEYDSRKRRAKIYRITFPNGMAFSSRTERIIDKERFIFSVFILAMEGQLLVLDASGEDWHFAPKLPRTRPQRVASDPHRPSRLYCGTFGQGLWLSDDSGVTWRRTGEGTVHPHVTSVAVSPKERSGGFGTAYAGTEPSALYLSRDGGETWEKPAELTELPSSKTWSFPPRPDTHHVRHISADPVHPGRIYLAIEAGALIRSYDGGRTWKDRVRGGPYDTHTLATNTDAPGRLYSAAGDGYFESDDYGESWQTSVAGLRQRYLYSVAVHPTDPETVLVSASPGPWAAYDQASAESYIYRKTDGREWKMVRTGLPEPEGTTASMLIAGSQAPGEFYAANSKGIYHSADAGLTWRETLRLPARYRGNHVWSLALVDE